MIAVPPASAQHRPDVAVDGLDLPERDLRVAVGASLVFRTACSRPSSASHRSMRADRLLSLAAGQPERSEGAGQEQSVAARDQRRSSQGSAYARSRSSLPPRSVRQSRRRPCVSAQTWPLAREILHRAIRTNQAAFERTLSEVMLTKKGALQVLELLAKLSREIGARAHEAPAVRIVIGGNLPLEGMRAVTPPALPVPTDPDALPDS
jgi:hypothetical protein